MTCRMILILLLGIGIRPALAQPVPAGHQPDEWAPYDFVKTDSSWRVSNSMWTVEPEAAIRPSE